MIETVHWEGSHGLVYEYGVYEIGTNFKPLPANYIYAQFLPGRGWRPVYIGQTTNLRDRVRQHHKIQCIQEQGAAYIHAHLTPTTEERCAEERDLLERWEPICNAKPAMPEPDGQLMTGAT